MKEKSPLRREGIYMFEGTSTSTPSIFPAALHSFSPLIYERNRDLLLAAAAKLAQVDPLEGGDLLQQWYPVARVHAELAHQLVSDIGESRQFPVPAQLEHFSVERAKRNIVERQIVVGSSSHEIDKTVLEALFERGIDPASVAVLIFDSHFDGMYPTGDLRSSFVSYLLQYGIGQISFIGIEEQLQEKYLYGEGNRLERLLDPSDLKVFHELNRRLSLELPENERQSALFTFLRQQDPVLVPIFFRDITHRHIVSPNRDRLHFVPRRYLHSTTDLSQQLNRIFNILQNTPSIKHLYISVDVDVLALFSQRITATTYSPFATIVAFGLNPLDKNVVDDGEINIRSLLGKQHKKHQLLHISSDGISTHSLTDVLSSLSSKAEAIGLTYGIPYHGSMFIGSITEMSGLDYRNNTIQAVLTINSAMRS